MSIDLMSVNAEFPSGFCLDNITWSITSGQHWVIVGKNGAGKSALVALLAGYAEINQGNINSTFTRIALVSYESQQRARCMKFYGKVTTIKIQLN